MLVTSLRIHKTVLLKDSELMFVCERLNFGKIRRRRSIEINHARQLHS